MFDSENNGIRDWSIDLFAFAIKRTSKPENRQAAIQWLLMSRDILSGNLGIAEKLKQLDGLLSARVAVSAIAGTVADAFRTIAPRRCRGR